jgi:hypothetical protein
MSQVVEENSALQIRVAYEYSAHEMTKGRKYFTTSNGYMGLGPNTLQSGDIVCIPYGCKVPHVVRVVPETNLPEEKSYRLVGECYVHGIMDGEAIEHRDEWCLAEETFNII